MTLFRLALLDLTRKKLSTFVAVVSIAVCVACGSLLYRLSVLSAARFTTLVQGPDAVVGAKAGGIELLLGSLNLEGPYPDFIPGVLYQSIQRPIRFDGGTFYDPSAVRSAVPIVIFGKSQDAPVLGTDQNFFHQPAGVEAPHLLKGTWFGPKNEIVVGSWVARNRGISVGDSVRVRVWTSRTSSPRLGVTLRVTGIFEAGLSAWNRACVSSLAEASRVFRETQAGNDSVSRGEMLHYILVYTRPGGFAGISELINQRSVAQLISVEAEKQHLAELVGSGVQIGLLMTLLVLMLSVLSVTGVMVTRFDAMRLQMAVLRAVGFTKAEIAGWLLWEGAMLGIVACTIGAVLDAGLYPLVRILLGSALPPEEIITSPFYAGAPFWIASLAGTMLAVLIPLLQVARQDPHTALKGL